MTDTDATATAMATEEIADVHFSFSRFNSYTWCPRQYMYAYVDDAEPDFMPLPMLLGVAVHKAMQIYNEGRMADRIPDIDDLFDAFDEVWEDGAEDLRLPKGMKPLGGTRPGPRDDKGPLRESPSCRGGCRRGVEVRVPALRGYSPRVRPHRPGGTKCRWRTGDYKP